MPKGFKEIDKYCQECGEKITLKNMRDVKRKRFCSRECLNKWNPMLHHKPKKLIFRICKTCGDEFQCFPSMKKIFCSRECFQHKPSRWTEKGYIKIPARDGSGRARVGEHILIAEKVLRRKLKDTEVVHHINMIKTDNRPENLLICTYPYHSYLHGRYAKRFAELHLGGLQCHREDLIPA